MKVFQGTEEITRVRGKIPHATAKFHPPIAFHHMDETGGVWRLFEKYLMFICGHRDDSYHPCSRYFFSVLGASAGTMNARALALGVAVE